ncbi:hypothetical protein C471_16037 [Halorubrum saccharovorum DSM 1137]|uniref:Uncharacterized protein n=1 Tax=Halorubrum saccharovorum DSM 1137 TaxID=1227484 RepID=M0DQ98_9EURY|nr:hypothetical protein C471_16037 [Halorubrum saccharovorum DSM 1137]
MAHVGGDSRVSHDVPDRLGDIWSACRDGHSTAVSFQQPAKYIRSVRTVSSRTARLSYVQWADLVLIFTLLPS